MADQVITVKKIQVKEETPMQRRGEKYRMNPKLYIQIENESIMQNLQNRRTRPHNTYKDEVIPQVIRALEKDHPELYRKLQNAKWGWRQDCGCSVCPCSPGFVATEVTGLETIWATI